MRRGDLLTCSVALSLGACAAPAPAPARPEPEPALTENARRIPEIIAAYQNRGKNGWPLIATLEAQLRRAIPPAAESPPGEVNEFAYVFEPRAGGEAGRERAIAALGRLEAAGFWLTMDEVAAASRFVGPARPVLVMDPWPPEFGTIRHAGRACSARLRLMLERGDAAESERSLRHLRALARMGAAEPSLTGTMLGDALERLTLQIIRGWMITHRLEAPMLEGLRRGLAAEPLPRAIGLETERLRLRDSVEQMYEGPSVHRNLAALGEEESAVEKQAAWLFILVPRIAGRSRALGCAATLSGRMLAVGAAPTHIGLLVADDVDSFVRNLPRSQLVVQTLAPNFGLFMKACALGEAEREGVRAMIAVELYRAERGVWPMDLSQLTPAYIEREPVDPYTGGPLRYWFEDHGYVLYSVGLDRIDNGGHECAGGRENAAFEEGAGFDLVFRRPGPVSQRSGGAG